MKSNAVSQSTRRKYEPVDDRLLATAGRCFLEDGFGFGIDDILAQSGVAKMSLYGKFGSKYGLIERLLDDAAQEWRAEIDRMAADVAVPGPEKIVRLLKAICTESRDTERRTGLLGQALIEFPRTGKEDETHQKKDQVHEKARGLQHDLLKSLETLCDNVGVADPRLLAQQLLLLANGYLIMEPLLGKAQAVKLTLQTAQALLGITSAVETPAQKSSRPTGMRVHKFKRILEQNGPKVI
jgi:AcrR family transcriptional regulator